jgi:acyl carrier protein
MSKISGIFPTDFFPLSKEIDDIMLTSELSFMDCVLACEESFNINLTRDELDNVVTVQDFLNLVVDHVIINEV